MYENKEGLNDLALKGKYLTQLKIDLDIRQKKVKKLIERKIARKVKEKELLSKAMGVGQDQTLQRMIEEDNEKIEKWRNQEKIARKNWLREF